MLPPWRAASRFRRRRLCALVAAALALGLLVTRARLGPAFQGKEEDAPDALGSLDNALSQVSTLQERVDAGNVIPKFGEEAAEVVSRAGKDAGNVIPKFGEEAAEVVSR